MKSIQLLLTIIACSILYMGCVNIKNSEHKPPSPKYELFTKINTKECVNCYSHLSSLKHIDPTISLTFVFDESDRKIDQFMKECIAAEGLQYSIMQSSEIYKSLNTQFKSEVWLFNENQDSLFCCPVDELTKNITRINSIPEICLKEISSYQLPDEMYFRYGAMMHSCCNQLLLTPIYQDYYLRLNHTSLELEEKIELSSNVAEDLYSFLFQNKNAYSEYCDLRKLTSRDPGNVKITRTKVDLDTIYYIVNIPFIETNEDTSHLDIRGDMALIKLFNDEYRFYKVIQPKGYYFNSYSFNVTNGRFFCGVIKYPLNDSTTNHYLYECETKGSVFQQMNIIEKEVPEFFRLHNLGYKFLDVISNEKYHLINMIPELVNNEDGRIIDLGISMDSFSYDEDMNTTAFPFLCTNLFEDTNNIYLLYRDLQSMFNIMYIDKLTNNILKTRRLVTNKDTLSNLLGIEVTTNNELFVVNEDYKVIKYKFEL